MLFAVAVTRGLTAQAASDPKCVNICISGGSNFATCLKACETSERRPQFRPLPPPPVLEVPKRVDTDCTSKGYQYGLCQSRCSP